MSHTASSFSILCIGFTAHTTLRHGIKISRFQFFVLDSELYMDGTQRRDTIHFQFFVLDSPGSYTCNVRLARPTFNSLYWIPMIGGMIVYNKFVKTFNSLYWIHEGMLECSRIVGDIFQFFVLDSQRHGV